MSHKKFGPDRFSRFDVYWIQTNRQTDRQTNRQAKLIYRLIRCIYLKLSYYTSLIRCICLKLSYYTSLIRCICLKLSYYTSLIRCICLKWINFYSPQYYILSSTTKHCSLFTKYYFMWFLHILVLFSDFWDLNLRKFIDPKKENSRVSFNDTILNFLLYLNSLYKNLKSINYKLFIQTSSLIPKNGGSL